MVHLYLYLTDKKKLPRFMARNHTLNLVLKKYVPIDQPQKLFIQYRGIKKYIKSTNYKILPSHWDRKKRKIKDKYISDYPKLQREISRLEKRIREHLVELQNETMTPKSALESIVSKPQKDKTLKDFLEQLSIKISESQTVKYSSFIQAIENIWGEQIKLSYLNDQSFCAKLSKKIKKTVSSNEYFAMLDRFTNEADIQNKEPFKRGGLRNKGIKQKRRIKKASKELDQRRFKSAPNDINTHLQLVSYLWYLYSFCLQGMDGIDLVNLDEKSLKSSSDKPLTHFHPNGNFINPVRDFNNKFYIIKGREKSGELVLALYNVFPVLFIRDWLHYLIGIHYPQYVYKGKDRIQLFNFKTVKPNGEKDLEVINGPWKQIRDNIRKFQMKLFGSSTKMARHSFTRHCEETGLSKFEIQRMLGHSVKEAVGSYLNDNTDIIARDINQMQVIEDFGVMRTLTMIFNMLRDKSYLGEPFIKISPDMFIAITLLEKGEGKLMDWSKEKEKRYQTLMTKIEDGRDILKDGKIVFESIPENEYPEELKALIRERNQVSSRAPKWIEPVTTEVIEGNNKLITEMLKKGILIPEN